MPNSTAFITRSAMKSKVVAAESSASSWTTRSNATSTPICSHLARQEQVPGNGERGRRPAPWTQSRQQGNPDPRYASRIRERPRHGDSYEGRGTRDRALPSPRTGGQGSRRLPDLRPAWRGRPFAAHSGSTRIERSHL